jgi:hypothetical protein
MGDEPAGYDEDQVSDDPTEHPEQHAALQTGEQGEAEPDTETDSEGGELLDSEEHSDAPGPFGTG